MKVIKNYLYNLGYQITALLVPFVMTPYVSRVFGPDGVGNYAVSYSIAQYFTLIGLLGINTYGTRQIAYCRDDKKTLKSAFWNLNYMRWITMGLTGVAYFLYVNFFVSNEDKLLYLAQGGILLAAFVDISWYYAGMEKFKDTAIRGMVVKSVGVLLVFLFVKNKEQVWLYALIISVTLFLGQLVMWKNIFKELNFVKPQRNIIKKYVFRSFKLWIPAIAINVYSSMDKVMLGVLINNSEAGIYENSQKIIRMVSAVTTTLATVMTPKMSNYYKNNNIKKIQEYVYKTFRFVTILSIPMTFGIIAVRNTFVPWFFGDGFEKITSLFVVSSWLVITLSWSNVLGNQVLIACGKEKYYTYSVIGGAVCNILFNLILIPHLYSMGAIIASVLAEYIGMFMMVYFSREIVNGKRLFKGLYQYFVAAFIMMMISFYIGEYIGYNMISTCVQIVIGMAIYVVVLLGMHNEVVITIINLSKQKRK